MMVELVSVDAAVLCNQSFVKHSAHDSVSLNQLLKRYLPRGPDEGKYLVGHTSRLIDD